MQESANALTIHSLADLFLEHCSDKSTLEEIYRVADDARLWSNGHALFQRIRQKTLKAEKSRNHLAICQYLFEESCAKTLYNLSGETAPFDQDCSEYVLKNARSLAQHFGLQDVDIDHRVWA